MASKPKILIKKKNVVIDDLSNPVHIVNKIDDSQQAPVSNDIPHKVIKKTPKVLRKKVPKPSDDNNKDSMSSTNNTHIDIRDDVHCYDLHNENEKIIEQFRLLETQIEHQIMYETSADAKKKHGFRLKHIKNAIEIFENYPGKIPNGKEAQKINGIGKGIGDRIDEILKTGTLKELTEKQFVIDFINSMKELCTITGIGQARARQLIDSFGVKGVADLQDKYDKGIIKVAKNQLTHHMVVGLKYYKDIMMKIPRAEIIKIEELLKIMIAKIDSKLILTVCGSYRRGRLLSGDIDVLITHPDLLTDGDVQNSKISCLIEFVDILTQLGFLIDNLTDKGKTKYMGICSLLFNKNEAIIMPGVNPGRRIDIRFVPYESYHAALLYFTGSGQFNKIFRGIALTKGYTVNEYGIYHLVNGKKGSVVPTSSEQEIFNLVGIKYLEPHERDF